MLKKLLYHVAKLQNKFFFDPVDESLGFSRFDEFIGYLKRKQWSAFEDGYKALAYDERHLLMTAIPQELNNPDLFADWRYYSQSYLALQFSGAVEIHNAWLARGNTWAEYIPDDKMEAYTQGFMKAFDYFSEAIIEGAEDAELYVGIIQTFVGGCPSEQAIIDTFNKVLALQDRHLPAAIYTLSALSERWHGSERSMFNFAYSLAEKDPFYNSIILCAHIDKWSYDTLDETPMAAYYFLGDDIRQEAPIIEKGDLCIQEGTRYFSLQASNIYAFVGYKTKIRLLANKHLLKIRHLYTSFPWQEEGNVKDIVNKARREMRLGALKKIK
ncbi:hypothetical protein AN944_00053 [Shewanella sp. P1-14-1]|uniref:hypothetical protein n=1 Tax=Shewanella sp. P1-14-1 TaxID=1723761 RepID=UPI0006D65E20|nr:hypothetical protein [Shewanella sp. P1-14-1]KPZ73469.1 hypothetical protein AN944_00053 [Shewanella sp. P1-14-1]